MNRKSLLILAMALMMVAPSTARADQWDSFIKFECYPELDYFNMEVITTSITDSPFGQLLVFADDPEFRDKIWEKYHIIGDTGGENVSYECELKQPIKIEFSLDQYFTRVAFNYKKQGSLQLSFMGDVIFDAPLMRSSSTRGAFPTQITYHAGRFFYKFCSGTHDLQCAEDYFFYFIESKEERKTILPITGLKMLKPIYEEQVDK